LDRGEPVRRREVRVPLRHLDRLVLHQLLHGGQIDAGHDEPLEPGGLRRARSGPEQ